MKMTVAEHKKKMGYTTKPVSPQCWNCSYCKIEKIVTHKGESWEGFRIKYLCNHGGFVVNKTASCDKHKFKDI